jgi:hypothetical protein
VAARNAPGTIAAKAKDRNKRFISIRKLKIEKIEKLKKLKLKKLKAANVSLKGK